MRKHHSSGECISTSRYKDAGVDIDAGSRLASEVIMPAIKSTARPGFPTWWVEPTIWRWRVGFEIWGFGLECSGKIPLPQWVRNNSPLVITTKPRHLIPEWVEAKTRNEEV